jgi:hypothetical protein
MTLEDQVCSLDLAKRLKELGVKQDSLFYWYPYAIGWRCRFVDELTSNIQKDVERLVSAFTVAELGKMLGKESNQVMFAEGKWASVAPQIFEITESDSEADARAKVLIYLLENIEQT